MEYNRLAVEKDEIIRKLYAEDGWSINYEVLLYARYFACIISLKLHNNPVGKYYYPNFENDKWGPGELNNLPKVT